MDVNNSGERAPQPRRTLGQYAKRGALAVLFGTILLIPRLRRLHRRLWVWSGIRLAAAALGGWLVWCFARQGAGPAAFLGGLLLLAFGLMIRAQPQTKSVDALAEEWNALIVLNGGTYRAPDQAVPVPKTQLLVCPDRIVVLGARDRCLMEIPLAKVQSLGAHATGPPDGSGAQPWEVEIHWSADPPGSALFRYEGAFAEHLARVSETILRGQWRKDLPVIQP